MAESTKRFLALDGTAGSISAPNLNSSPPTAFLEVDIGGAIHELYSLPSGAGVHATQRVHSVPALTEVYRYNGRPLLVGGVGESRLENPTRPRQFLKVAVWQGPHHDLLTHFYWASTQDLIAFLDNFGIEDSPEGATATIHRPSDVAVTKGPSLVEQIEGIGLIEFQQRTRPTSRKLPNWRGKQTRNGMELFVERPGAENMYYVLASTTALGIVSPTKRSAQTEVADRLEDVLLTWG